MLKRLKTYGLLAKRVLPMLTGRSYYHVPQPVGRRFEPGQLAGYFIDFTHKTDWEGPRDDRGIPMNRDGDGNPVYFAITVAQKALGHWDRWLASEGSDDEQLRAFASICGWLADEQDDNGGWAIWFLKPPHYTSRYSAMAQGEAASVLVRAFQQTGDVRYREAAARSLSLMLRPIENGGTARTGDGLILEEYPRTPPSAVLNGWIFALYGLHDYLLIHEDAAYRDALTSTVATLADRLPAFDNGYWSLYDEGGNLAAPFYHTLHIDQLEALRRTFPEHAQTWEHWVDRWRKHGGSRVNRARAVAAKTWQKIVHPPDVITR